MNRRLIQNMGPETHQQEDGKPEQGTEQLV